METRLAVIGVIVENLGASERVNDLLHDFADYIVGRMGIPYRKKGVSVLSVVIDAPETVINSLSGKLGMIADVTAKTLYSKF